MRKRRVMMIQMTRHRRRRRPLKRNLLRRDIRLVIRTPNGAHRGYFRLFGGGTISSSPCVSASFFLLSVGPCLVIARHVKPFDPKKRNIRRLRPSIPFSRWRFSCSFGLILCVFRLRLLDPSQFALQSLGYNYITVRGKPAPASVAPVMVCNHRSLVDPAFFLWYLYPDIPVFVSAEGVRTFYVLGAVAKVLDTIFVDMQSGVSGHETMTRLVRCISA